MPPVRIGCHSAMWGDTSMSAPQLIKSGKIDYLVGDYLAEVTMAILARAHQKSKGKFGFATDFVGMMARNLKEIKQRKVKVLVNAGGVNPEGCREALKQVCEKANISLNIAVITGDNLAGQQFPDVKEMFSGATFPKNPMSVNAYLGAFPIAAALSAGADVVITGRCVDSALVLAPLIHEHKWKATDYDKLSAGTLAGHIVECGAQGTGGLFTDWFKIPSWVNMGYPIVNVAESGDFTLTKPANTHGLISPAAATEQLLYEIGDPGAYHVPDVACDFTQVTMTQLDKDTIVIQGAKGQAPTSTYKVCATYADGFSIVPSFVITGRGAAPKAQRTAETLVQRWSHMLQAAKLGPFSEVHIELIGGGGTRFRQEQLAREAREIVVRIAVRHTNLKAMKLVRKEIACAGVSMGQGTIGIIPGLAAPSPVIRCFSFLVEKNSMPAPKFHCSSGAEGSVPVATHGGFPGSASRLITVPPMKENVDFGPIEVMPLDNIAHGRSGDKGDIANIGIIARKEAYLPYLRKVLTEDVVKKHFRHICKGKVERFDLPGTNSMNFLLHNALGGGGTSSLHSDPLGKTFASQLLAIELPIPVAWKMPEFARL